jgi:NAD(P)H-flavin reductase
LPETEWKFVEGTLDQTVLEKLIDTSTQPVVYISGPPAMVASTRRIVKALGIKHIKVDEFVGY